MKRSGGTLSRAAVYAALCLISIASMAPLLWQVRSSFMPIADIFKIPMIILPKNLEFGNYREVFTLVPFARYYLNTVLVVLVNIAGAFFSNTCIAYAIARIDFRGRKLMYALSLGTMMLPASVQLIPFFIEWNWLHGINTFLPLTVPAFFGNAFFIFMLVQFLKTLPKDYDEAAFIDGANHPRILVSVIVPLAKPALAVVAIFQFMATWNDFMGPLLFLNDSKLYTLAIGLRSFISTFYTPWPVLMAAATLTVAPLIALFFAAQRSFVEGLAMGGLKG